MKVLSVVFVPVKRRETLTRRGLDMARAAEVFEGRTLTVQDDRRDFGEERFVTIGFLDQRMVVVVWTARNGARRIISMRKTNEREQAHYGVRLGPG